MGHRGLQPDQALTPLVGRVLESHAAERERGADRLEGGWREAMRIMPPVAE
jgi:hypothetical protein